METGTPRSVAPAARGLEEGFADPFDDERPTEAKTLAEWLRAVPKD
jgi:hypothetical protein